MLGWVGKGIAFMIGLKLAGLLAFVALCVLGVIVFGICLLVDWWRTRRWLKRQEKERNI